MDFLRANLTVCARCVIFLAGFVSHVGAMSRWARCWFCGRHFGNKQAVRAHLGWCREYARWKEEGEEPPRIKKPDVSLAFIYRCPECGEQSTHDHQGEIVCLNHVFDPVSYPEHGHPKKELVEIYLCVGKEKVKLK